MKNHKITKPVTNINRLFELRDENKCVAWSMGYRDRKYIIKPAAFMVNMSAQMLYNLIKLDSIYEVDKIDK